MKHSGGQPGLKPRTAWRCRVIASGGAVLVAAGFSTAANADTLSQAMASAYRSNPSILAQRKRLEATDEQVPQALANWRPRVIGRADAGRDTSRLSPSLGASGTTTPRGYQIDLSQSVFRGFRNLNGIRQAEANVLAAREDLRVVEQDTLLDAVTAYVDVVRDRAVVRFRQNDLRVLQKELKAATDRFSAGDATKTDVAQARARRAGSAAALDLAKSNLRTSRANYARVIGREPGKLATARVPFALLPRGLQGAIDTAQGENPAVVAAAFRELSAQHAIDLVRGELLPEVDLEANYSNRFEPSVTTNQRESASATLRLTVPFYQGGQVYARVRAAKREREAAAQEIEVARLRARSDVTAAWSQLVAARAQLVSNRIQLAANRTALSGVRAEERVGQRTVLDVLDAEQELLNSQNALVSTQRDIVVAAYTVLRAMGKLTAADVNLPVEQHDPEVHYGLVRNKAWGTTVVRNEAYEGYVLP